MFERYGGFAKVSRIVAEFYDRVLNSDVLSEYFVGVDMKRQIDHQTKFFAYLMGGPVAFTDEHLVTVHRRLAITDEAFEELAIVLRETLEDYEVDETDIGVIQSGFVNRKPYIVFGE
ncbi:MAG: group 1 truncated hemoglobin [Acidimicrobiia bacterium]